MEFSAAVSFEGDHVHLCVVGELDVFTASGLRRQLQDALAQGGTRFKVDAADVTFVDAAGLGELVRLRNAVTPVGGTVTFVAASPAFRRACQVAGLTRAFRLSAPSEQVEYDMA